MNEHCPCGLPLHYRTAASLVEQLGPFVKIVVESRAWMVPRHYIALHGVRGMDLPRLAKEFGFVEVTP